MSIHFCTYITAPPRAAALPLKNVFLSNIVIPPVTLMLPLSPVKAVLSMKLLKVMLARVHVALLSARTTPPPYPALYAHCVSCQHGNKPECTHIGMHTLQRQALKSATTATNKEALTAHFANIYPIQHDKYSTITNADLQRTHLLFSKVALLN